MEPSQMATEGTTQESTSSLELPYEYLKKITKNFSDDEKIGESQFGTLYKGTRDDGKVIAVKKLHEQPELPTDKTFKKEVQLIMDLKHENIVELVGFCTGVEKNVVLKEGIHIKSDVTENLLCYEYLPNGSLDDYLFGTKAVEKSTSLESSISWETRFKIVKGICQGLHFLHNFATPIIHMDLNHTSIWLSENMVPKISNFGLSRLFGHGQTRMNTQTVVGLFGYMAPEYLFLGEISAQADIYSLGRMIIEISTGEKSHSDDKNWAASQYIDKVREYWTAEQIATKYSSYDAESLQQVKACINIGLKCVEIDRKTRPSIAEILDMLNAT